MSGQVVHFEIPADDLERAQSFYREAFGWEINPMPELGYTTVNTASVDASGRPTEPGSINGGMLTRQQPISNPVVVIGVDDIDDALQQVQDRGGAVVRPKDEVGGMGYAAYFTDTEGNVVGLWQSMS